MERLHTIREKIAPVFDADVALYNIDWVKRDGMKILEILITRESSPVDVELCSEVSNKISLILDEIDLIPEDYYLEVASAGAEREIRDEKELQEAIGKYIYLKLEKPEKGFDEILGTLLSKNEDGELEVEFFVKGVKKKLKLSIDNIAYISHAVKL